MKADTMTDEPIKAGYKHTEIGIIPTDWDAKQLGDVAEIVMGQSPIGSSYNTGGYGTPLINGPTEFRHRSPIKIQWTTQPTKLSKKGDVLLCVRGSSTGRINVSDDTYCIGRGVAAIRSKSKEDSAFILYLVTAAVEEILLLTTGSTFPNIDGKTLRGITIRYPLSPDERRSIAEALSDVDALLGALDRLIAKKRAIKQGTMQALLTGRVRLPGFMRKPGYKRTEVGVIPEDWEVKTFDELFDFLSTSSCSRSDLSESGNIHYIHYGDIHTRWDYNLDFDAESVPLVAFEKVKNIARLQDGDLIMVDASEDEEGVGKSVEILNLGGRSAVAGLHTLALRSKGGDLVNGFKAYLQANQAVRTQIRRVATGLKVFGISKNNLRDIFVPLPGPLEQTAIAEVLSDMDAEIETLERRRAKVRAIKQGMMQELLTGRVRLVGPNAEQ